MLILMDNMKFLLTAHYLIVLWYFLPFFWTYLVVFGSPLGETSGKYKVFNIKFAMLVDLTDFWTTELMGVEVKSCSCEPDELSQIQREENMIIEKSCQKVGNQWLIPYPWKKDPSHLPGNRACSVVN